MTALAPSRRNAIDQSIDSGIIEIGNAAMLIETRHLARHYTLEIDRWIPKQLDPHHAEGLSNVEVGHISDTLADLVITFPISTLRFFKWSLNILNDVDAIPEFIEAMRDNHNSPDILLLSKTQIDRCCHGKALWHADIRALTWELVQQGIIPEPKMLIAAIKDNQCPNLRFINGNYTAERVKSAAHILAQSAPQKFLRKCFRNLKSNADAFTNGEANFLLE